MRKTGFISNPYSILAISIYSIQNLIAAICKQISFVYSIRTIKSTQFRIIVPAPQVIQPRLLIEHIPAIPKRLHLAQRFRQFASAPQRRAPRIVVVADDCIAIFIQNRNNIALQVLNIRIRRAHCTPPPPGGSARRRRSAAHHRRASYAQCSYHAGCSLLPPHLLSFSPATRFHYTQTRRRCQCSASAQAAVAISNDGKQDLSTTLPLKNAISQQHSTQRKIKMDYL